MISLSMKIKQMIGKRILVTLTEGKVKQGSLFIPDGLKRKRGEGTVAMVGDEVTEVKVGDYVLFDEHVGSRISDSDVILSEDDVTCKIEGLKDWAL